MTTEAAAPQPSREIILLRHAPALTQGRVTGRRDVAIADIDEDKIRKLASKIAPIDHLVTSPARRCVETAQRLIKHMEPHCEAGLWEQDFGEWEGLLSAQVPDIGTLSADALARYCPPGGESFAEVCVRVRSVIQALASGKARRIAVIAHAGSIRAALAVALGVDPGVALKFEVAPLSRTKIRAMADGTFAIAYINRITSAVE